MDSLVTKREIHPYMQLDDKVLIPLVPPPAPHKGSSHSANGPNSSLRNLFGILMGLCLFIVYVYWSSSTAASISVAGSSTAKNSGTAQGDTSLGAGEGAPGEADNLYVCFTNWKDHRKFYDTPASAAPAGASSSTTQPHSPDVPVIYFVTPTYPRREQLAELTRLGQTLMHVPNLHWIVADDNAVCNNMLDDLLLDFGIPYTHLASPMPEKYRKESTAPRGVANRRAALQWIKANNIKTGVLYFGDDDNTFHLKLFTEIRNTKIVSMFPVGLIGKYAVSSPIVKDGKVVGFFDSWPAQRRFAVDMAGFAVNVAYMAQYPNVTMPYKAGHEEDQFLQSINLRLEDIEPKANYCTEILVWHTRTSKQKAPTLRVEDEIMFTDSTSLGALLRKLDALGVSFYSSTKGIKAEYAINGKTKPLLAVLD